MYGDDVAARAAVYRGAAQASPDGVPVVAGNQRVAEARTPSLPTRPPGPIIQTRADHRARPLGTWQSDNAVDIGVPTATDVLAVDDGEIVKVDGSAPRRGAGAIGGYSITLRTRSNQFFYTHLLRVRVQPGERVTAAQVIGASGFANNVEHLHIAAEHGDPTGLWANGAPDQQTTPLGGCDDGAVGPANLGQARTVRTPQTFATLPAWAMAGSRAPAQIDARIVPDALWILRTYQLRVTAGREAGHASHGDGSALDLVPADPSGGQAAWDQSALRLARDIGWIDDCAASGVAPACPLKPWVRFVGYNGYPDHGDPAPVGANAHLHISWLAAGVWSALAAPNEWVRVFPVPASLQAGT
ncbi:MAG: M23 family metallopeptidase [Solirubrobacteraceae bacterium]